MRIHEDPGPDPGQILKSQKVEIYMKNILKVLYHVICQNIPRKVPT
jgi:hypothetical protein